MVDLVRKHSNEHEHEKEACNCKNKHENALHKSSHHMLRLIVDLVHLRVSLFNICRLESTDFLDDSLVFFKLLLKTFGELLHPRDH